MKINKKSLVIASMALAFVGVFSFSFSALAITASDMGLEYASALNMGTQDLRASIMQIINVLMGFLGIIAVIIILAGGFKWMTAGGAEDKIDEARKLIVAGIVGLAIILASYAIAFFVLDQLLKATQ